MNRLFRVERPKNYLDVVGAHLPWVLISGFILLAAWFIPFKRIPISVCGFLCVTGAPCPFCGMSRAFASLAHGGWAEVIRQNPLAVALFVLTLLVLVWNLAGLAVRRRISPGPLLVPGRRVAAWLWVIVAAAFVLNWSYVMAWR